MMKHLLIALLFVANICHGQFTGMRIGATVAAGGATVVPFSANNAYADVSIAGEVTNTGVTNGTAGNATSTKQFTGNGFISWKVTYNDPFNEQQINVTDGTNTYQIVYNPESPYVLSRYNGTLVNVYSFSTYNTLFFKLERTGSTIVLKTSSTLGGTYTTLETFVTGNSNALRVNVDIGGNLNKVQNVTMFGTITNYP